MSAFAERVDAFLAEYFALHPLVRDERPACTTTTAAGPIRPRSGRARPLAFYDRWTAELVDVRRRRT